MSQLYNNSKIANTAGRMNWRQCGLQYSNWPESFISAKNEHLTGEGSSYPARYFPKICHCRLSTVALLYRNPAQQQTHHHTVADER